MNRNRKFFLVLVALLVNVVLLSTAGPALAGPFTDIDDVTVVDPACVGEGTLHVTGFHDGVPLPRNYITAQADGSPFIDRVDLPALDFPDSYAINIHYMAPPAPGLGFDVVVKLWGTFDVDMPFPIPDIDLPEIDMQTVTEPIPCNVPPVANNDAYNTDEDTQLVVGAPGVLGNDTDANFDPLTASLFTAPLHGTVALNGNGSFVYDPDDDYFGPDGFRYRANDGAAFSNVAVVLITVNEVNDPPTANDDSASTTLNTAVFINVAANDSGLPESDLVIGSASPTTQPANGSAVSGPGPGEITYTPNNGFKGIDTFDYEICDDGMPVLCDTATVTVEVTTPGGGGGGGGAGDVPDNPSQAGDHANDRACADMPDNAQANEHRPGNLPPCR